MTSPLTITSLVTATSYDFRVIAHNLHGSSVESVDLTLTTDTDVPDAPTNVVVALDADNLRYLITWDDGTSDNGLTVSKYQIWIQKKDLTYAKETLTCDGETNATIQTTNQCYVLMSNLRATPFLLEYLDDVIAYVQSFNADGWSANSATSATGVLIEDVPVQMATPTSTDI